VVLLSSLGRTEADAAQMVEGHANKLLAELNRPYRIGGLTHHTTASIGVTLFNGRSASVDELMRQADLAMYRAKAAGRNAVRFFDPAIGAAVKARADLEADLRRAIAERELVLHYQSQVLGEDSVTGAEVLVRWQHPQRGMISPADFIPLAEETDLILPLGLWVLETACERLAAWSKDRRLSSLSIAVNVSAKQFLQPDFVDQVFSVVKRYDIDPHRLKLELTESLLLQDIERIIEKMQRLKALGVGFSLDDFGTGYSSLSYLKRLPLDQLKIDQSFVRDVLSDPNDAAIAKTIVALGRTLGLEVIAEGVETQEQMDFLASIGCHAYQGFLLSRPVPVAEFEQQLRMS
jgi:EAL domain-containing protein (putative c-di-GMP-specific phosphodiesterase class I)